MRMVFPNKMTGQFFDDLASEMNSFVESMLGEDGKTATSNSVAFTPRMDIDETETHFLLSMDLPGVHMDDVSIDMEDDQMVIQGHRPRSVVGDIQHRRAERVFGDFRRTVKMPKLVDKEAITAAFADGVLTVTLPKMVEQKSSRKIQISKGTGATKVETNGTTSEL